MRQRCAKTYHALELSVSGGDWRGPCGRTAPFCESLETRQLLSGDSSAIQFFDTRPAVFVQNAGQWSDPSVYYAYNSGGASIAFGSDGLRFRLAQSAAAPSTDPALAALSESPGPATTQSTSFSMHFVGAAAVTPQGSQQSEGVYNYFLGDQSNWRSNVPGYQVVSYANLYEGVTLDTFGQHGSMKYEFHVAPGADYQQIQIHYDGIAGLSLAADGTLRIQTALGEIVDDAPVIYQMIGGQRVEVAGKFVLLDDATYTFEVTGTWDNRYELVLDPELEWSSYLGGSKYDCPRGVATDAAGNAWVTGETLSANWVTGGFETSYGGQWDAFVTKINASGTLAWSTYVGGGGYDVGCGIAADAAGNVWVLGDTEPDGWASGGGITDLGVDVYGNEPIVGFVAKINANGTPSWSTYLATTVNQWAGDIAVDSTGCAFVTGRTEVYRYLGDDEYDQNYAAFVKKIAADGSIAWSLRLQGSGLDEGRSIAVDRGGTVWVTGYTESTEWTNGALGGTSSSGGYDGFLAKISSGGTLAWARHFGGSGGGDGGEDIAVDRDGNVWITGSTDSSGWASGGFDTSYNGGMDAFVIKVGSSGTVLWSSYLGGGSHDEGADIAVDDSGNVWIAGDTSSSGWVSGGFDSTYGGNGEGFVAMIGPDDELVWSSYLGPHTAEGLALDSNGGVWLAFGSSSTEIAQGGFDTTPNGDTDALIVKLSTWNGDAGFEWLARDAAYDDELSSGDFIGGYRVAWVFDDEFTGFHALWLTSESKDPVLLLRGTQPTYVNDVLADFSVGGIGFEQFEAARTDVETWLATAGSKHVDFVGHSLGGALAQFFAADWTSKGHQIGQVVTFNSPGISQTCADQFVPALAERVMHYVVSGDLVSMAGEAFIEGQYTLASFRDLNLVNKHVLPILAATAGGRTRPDSKGLALAAPESTDSLNDPWFMYRDKDYFTILAAAQIATSTISTLKPLASLPSALLFRKTTEAKRQQIGQSWDDIQKKLILTINPASASLKLPDVQMKLGGALDIQTSGLSLRYTASPSQSFRIQGKLSLPQVYNATADFSGSNYIEVGEDGWEVVGALSVSNVVIVPGVWELKNASLTIDTPAHAVSGEATLRIPSGVELSAGIRFVDGLLNSASLGASNLNKPLGASGVFLQAISGSVEHMSDQNAIAFSGNVTLTAGPQLSVNLPAWAGGSFSGSLMKLELSATIDRYHLAGAGSAQVINGLANSKINADLNWSTGLFSSTLSINAIDSLITGSGSLTANSYWDVTYTGQGDVNIPSSIKLAGGATLASASEMLRFTNNGDYKDDFIAGWTMIDVPLLGQRQWGYAVYFDGSVRILGASDINALQPAAPAMAAMMSLAAEEPEINATPTTVSREFNVGNATPFALFSVCWDGATTNPAITLRSPSGATLDSTTFAAGTEACIVDALSGVKRVTIAVPNPAAGTWALEIEDDGSLGTTTVAAAAGLSQPTLTLGVPSSSDGNVSVSVPYSFSNAGAGAKLTLYYDTDGSGLNGQRLAEASVGSSASGSYTWYTAGLPSGSYYLYAILTDNSHAPTISAYTATPIVVTRGTTLVIKGTRGKDSISANVSSGTLLVTGQGFVSNYPAQLLTRLKIEGLEGNDSLKVSPSVAIPCSIFGGGGNDSITGGAGADSLDGGSGYDTLRGGAGSDRLYGQGNNDYLYGDAGNDTLYGGAGNDKLYGNTGADYLYGDSGDDVLFAIDRARDYLTGGAGRDTAHWDSAQDSRKDRLESLLRT